MEGIELGKNLLSGIFHMNNELRDIDDSIFIRLIKSGIEKAANGESAIFNELFEHAVQLYIDEWVRNALEDDEHPDLGLVKERARNAFMVFYYCEP